jgi:hypothetical protein
MSQMTQAAALLDAIKQDCIDAWGLTNGTVHYDQVRIPETSRDYALIQMLPVDMTALTARSVRQDFLFRITRRAPFPASGNLTLYKIEQANLLIAELITGPKYADIAFLPYVTQYDPLEEDDPQNSYVEFSVTFSCAVEEQHH